MKKLSQGTLTAALAAATIIIAAVCVIIVKHNSAL